MFFNNMGEWDAFEDTGRAAEKHIITDFGFVSLFMSIRYWLVEINPDRSEQSLLFPTEHVCFC